MGYRRTVFGRSKNSFGYFPTANKFLGSVVAQNGNAYLIPYNYTNLVEFTDGNTVVLKSAMTGYGSAVVAPNGNIYLSPHSKNKIGRYNITANNLVEIGSDLTFGDTVNRHLGGNLAQNGMIYFFPAHGSKIIKVNPNNNSVTEIEPNLGMNAKWQGSILHANGKIYAIPNASIRILEFNPITETSQLVGNSFSGIPENSSYFGGAVYAFNDKIYLIPRNYPYIVEFNPLDLSWQNVGPNFGSGDKFVKGSLLPNGNILLTPNGYGKLVEFNPTTYSVTEITNLSGYFGSSINRKGNVILTPITATKIYVHKTGIPLLASDYTIPSNLADLPSSNYNKFFNKF